MLSFSKRILTRVPIISLSLLTGLCFLPMSYGQSATPWQGQVMQQSGSQAAQADSTENILIILDASGSMGQTLAEGEPKPGEQTKLAMAKQTILNVLKNVPPNVRVGLRVYGDKAGGWDPCNDSRLVTPVGPNNRLRIASELINIKPNGATPISFSLMQAVRQDFAGITGHKTIILVSDGMETCDADPCNVMVDMLRSGVDIKVDVLGFGIHDYAATRQLQCVAKSTFGKYIDAQNSEQLLDGLTRALGAQTAVAGQIVLPPSTQAPKPAVTVQKPVTQVAPELIAPPPAAKVIGSPPTKRKPLLFKPKTLAKSKTKKG